MNEKSLEASLNLLFCCLLFGWLIGLLVVFDYCMVSGRIIVFLPVGYILANCYLVLWYFRLTTCTSSIPSEIDLLHCAIHHCAEELTFLSSVFCLCRNDKKPP